MAEVLVTHSADETQALGVELGRCLAPGEVLIEGEAFSAEKTECG